MKDTGGWSGRKVTQTVEAYKQRCSVLGLPCAICGRPINYLLVYPHPDRFSLDHIVPRAVRPDLAWDPSNWQPSHLGCNKSKGARPHTQPGITSRQW